MNGKQRINIFLQGSKHAALETLGTAGNLLLKPLAASRPDDRRTAGSHQGGHTLQCSRPPTYGATLKKILEQLIRVYMFTLESYCAIILLF
jgi:hypothetical protein